MSSNKIGRINEDIQRVMSALLRNVKDPRVNQGMMSVTAVDTTGDLRYSKIYLSVMGLQSEKELLKGYIDIIILSMLYHEDLYGYDLGKRVKERTQNSFELKEGTLYLAFKRLEQSGLIESYWGEQGVGGRRKY
jgi:hypothetical protein